MRLLSEENNNTGKTSDLFRESESSQGKVFHPEMDTIKDKNGKRPCRQ